MALHIAANLVKTRYRFRSRHPEVSLDANPDQTAAVCATRCQDASPTPSDCVQAKERAEAVRRAVAELPADLRTPLLLAEYEERSQAEIGEILAARQGVETRIYRARRQLRVALGKLLEAV